MNSQRNGLVLFSGNGNKPLSEAISKQLRIPLAEAKVARFSDGEISIDIQENVFKRLIANSKHPNETFCDELYVELYGKTQDELWMDFTIDTGINNGLNGQDHFLIEDNIFTYWLFLILL